MAIICCHILRGQLNIADHVLLNLLTAEEIWNKVMASIKVTVITNKYYEIPKMLLLASILIKNEGFADVLYCPCT